MGRWFSSGDEKAVCCEGLEVFGVVSCAVSDRACVGAGPVLGLSQGHRPEQLWLAQINTLTAGFVGEHWAKQIGRLPPLPTQVRKQLTFCMHPGAAWHVANAWQQLCCRQFWQVEPSDGQLAVPQMFVVHAPVQHSPAVMQG